ncbi:hypothetical protein ACT7C3_09550 [Bacillus pacificus]
MGKVQHIDAKQGPILKKVSFIYPYAINGCR